MPTIRDAFQAAKMPNSSGGATVTKAELQAIVRNAGALDAAAKTDIATEFAAAKATPAATKEYARLAAKYGFASLSDRLSTTPGVGGASPGGASTGGSSPSGVGSASPGGGGHVGGGSPSGRGVGGGSGGGGGGVGGGS